MHSIRKKGGLQSENSWAHRGPRAASAISPPQVGDLYALGGTEEDSSCHSATGRTSRPMPSGLSGSACREYRSRIEKAWAMPRLPKKYANGRLVSCRKQPFSCRAVPAHEHVPGVLNTGQPVRAGQQFLRLGLRGTRKPTMGTRERARKPCLRAARARNFHLPVRRPPARGAGVEGAGRQPGRGGTTNATAVVGGSASEPLRPRPVFWEPDGNRPAVLGQRSRFSTTTMRASGWNSTLGKRTCSCS